VSVLIKKYLSSRLYRLQRFPSGLCWLVVLIVACKRHDLHARKRTVRSGLFEFGVLSALLS